MELSHKTKVVVQYLVPVATAYFILAVFVFTGTVPKGDDIAAHLGGIAGLTVAAALAQDVVPKGFKEFLVFHRFNHRLPGHRAFTTDFQQPSRYDLARITNLGILSALGPEEQQRVFYRVYRKHDKDPRVEHYSFRYLAWRDSASTLLLLSVVTIPVLGGFPDFTALMPALKLTALTFAAYVATALAARQAANELVCQVLAAETLGDPHDISQ